MRCNLTSALAVWFGCGWWSPVQCILGRRLSEVRWIGDECALSQMLRRS